MSALDEIDREISEQQARLCRVPTTWSKQQVDTLVADVEEKMRSLNARRARAARFEKRGR